MEATVKGRVVTHADGRVEELMYTPLPGDTVLVDGKAVVVEPGEPEARRKIQCPHCQRVIVEGQNLCCEKLSQELQELAQTCGSDIFKLQTAFEKWFNDHKVEN